MHTCRRITAVLAVSLVASGLAGAAAPAQPYRPQPGGKARYTIRASVVVKGTGAGRSAATREKLQMTCAADFPRSPSPGWIQVRGRVLSGTLESSTRGVKRLGPMEANYTLDSLGVLQSTRVLSGSKVVFSESRAMIGPEDAFAPEDLPKATLKVGTAWTGIMPGKGLDGGTLRSSSRVLRETSYGGHKCLEIRSQLSDSRPLQLPIASLGRSISGNAVMKVAVTWLFDPSQGLVLKRDGTSHVDIKADGESAGPIHVTYQTDFHARLTDWNGQKVSGS